ncbi:PilZ domain-containing protein [Aquisediminimonas sediminicola]|uniref:PilZ domain-containing protein n=1 Tax=Alteraquisediminimonas sediminicola TaxID=2676787 RepID=UPI001C8E3748|nr:PilZ domain-containing protein [Aquisediminimonas sediminicola]
MRSPSVSEFATEHQGNDRITTIFRPVAINVGTFQGLCLVRNISPEGMMGHVHTDIEVGASITVQMLGDLDLEGRIIWANDGRIGVQFNRRIDVMDVLRKMSRRVLDGNIQRAPRITIPCKADLYMGQQLLHISVLDVSQGGAKIITDGLRIDQEVTIMIEGLDSRRAKVCWTKTNQVGLTFFRELTFAELTQWAISMHHRKHSAQQSSH